MVYSMSDAGSTPSPRMTQQVPLTREITPEGKLRETASDADRTLASLSHLWLLAGTLIGPLCLAGPLVVWAIRREESPLVDDHGREILNSQISYFLMCLLTAITLIGPVVVTVIYLIAMVRGAVSASRGEYFRYPMTVRFIQ